MPLRENWLHDREYLYKYCTANTAKIILDTARLRLSHPSLFNDPFDVQFDLQIDFDLKTIKQRSLAKLWNVIYEGHEIVPGNLLGDMLIHYRTKFPRLTRAKFEHEFGEAFEEGADALIRALPQYHKDAREILDQTHILCLTEIFDDILMWSHYANLHTGAVIGFRCIADLDSAMGAAQSVVYSTKMPRLGSEEFFVNLFAAAVAFDPSQEVHKLVMTKARHWSYERE